jgi:hypothetical protein
MKTGLVGISLFALTGMLLGCQIAGTSLPPTSTAEALETQVVIPPRTEPAVTPFLPETSVPSPSPAIPAGLDPRVDIDVVDNVYHVGDLIFIAGFPKDIAGPIYSLVVRDQGVQEAQAMVEVSMDNQVTIYPGESQVLEFISADASAEQVTFVLRAKAAGSATVTIEAIGIIHSDDPSNGLELMGSGDVNLVVEK